MAKLLFTKQSFIKELTISEHIILGLNVILSLSLFIIQLAGLHAYDKGTTGVSFAATVMSIFSVMAGVKQRILCPLLGIICSVLLVANAGVLGLYGSMIMYGFNIFVQIFSLVAGLKSSKNKITIEPNHVKGKWAIIYVVVLIGLTALFTGVEGLSGFNKFGSGDKTAQPKKLVIRIFDATNLIFTIGCFLPMVKRYNQVWGLYLICDIAIAMVNLFNGIYAIDDQTRLVSFSMMCSGLCMGAACVLGIISGKKKLKGKNTGVSSKN